MASVLMVCGLLQINADSHAFSPRFIYASCSSKKHQCAHILFLIRTLEIGGMGGRLMNLLEAKATLESFGGCLVSPIQKPTRVSLHPFYGRQSLGSFCTVSPECANELNKWRNGPSPRVL
jgi:hypothetical protein